MLGDGQPGESDAQARPRRLGHLAIDQRRLALGKLLEVDDARLLELDPQIVALARPLAHAGEDREAAMVAGDVVDQLLDDDRLANARAAEEADLSALEERLDQVNDLDPGLEHLLRCGLLIERRSLAMDRHMKLGCDWPKLVHRIAQHVHHATQSSAAHWNRNPRARVDGLHPAHQAIGRHHRDAAHASLAQVLFHLDDHAHRLRNIEAVADDA